MSQAVRHYEATDSAGVTWKARSKRRYRFCIVARRPVHGMTTAATVAWAGRRELAERAATMMLNKHPTASVDIIPARRAK